jgi:hypothetical protein
MAHCRYVNQTQACEPWCETHSAETAARGSSGLGEPAKGLSITFAQRTYALPPPKLS